MNPSLLATRSLLDSTALVRKQVENLNRMTGTQYNVFDILRLATHENSHSLIISDLLNPKGSHGQGKVFLEAFMLELENKSVFSSIEIIKDYLSVLLTLKSEYMTRTTHWLAT